MPMPRRPRVALNPDNHDALLSLLDFDRDTGVFTWKITRGGSAKSGTIAGAKDKNGYINIRVLRKLYKAHRLAWFYVHGKWPSQDLDHVDRDKTNNAMANLREASSAQNVANSLVRIDCKANLKGVRLANGCKNVWVARITENGKRRTIGRYNSPSIAYEAYCEAARAHFKQFARV